MNACLLVGLGGALGATARFGVGRPFGAQSFPWATLAVNVAGGLPMGLLAGWLVGRGANEHLQLFPGVGLSGRFTTFSAFSLQTILQVVRGGRARQPCTWRDLWWHQGAPLRSGCG